MAYVTLLLDVSMSLYLHSRVFPPLIQSVIKYSLREILVEDHSDFNSS